MNQPNYGSFTTHFDIEGESAFIAIHPEMYPATQGIEPRGRYFIYCIHPERGSCTFTVEQDEHGTWFAENQPAFVDESLVTWLGRQISMHPH